MSSSQGVAAMCRASSPATRCAAEHRPGSSSEECGKRRAGIAGWRSYRGWPAPRAIKERAWLDRTSAAADAFLLQAGAGPDSARENPHQRAS